VCPLKANTFSRQRKINSNESLSSRSATQRDRVYAKQRFFSSLLEAATKLSSGVGWWIKAIQLGAEASRNAAA
jgi:hypothetical protein